MDFIWVRESNQSNFYCAYGMLNNCVFFAQGKSLPEGKAEVGYGGAFVEWFAQEARRIYGDTIESPAPSKRIIVIKQPVGVASMITPVGDLCVFIHAS